MTAVPSPAQEERLWSQLTGFIQEGSVVPIIGPDLLDIARADGTYKNFYTLVAEELAGRLGLEPPRATGRRALNEVASAFLAARGQSEDLYPEVKQIVQGLEKTVPVPEALSKLAAMPFRLFVSTSFDALLVRAIELRWPTWAGRIRQLEYSPVRKADLDSSQDLDGPPVVFHLFGRASSMPEYAVTEEDVLEFMHALQSEERRPEKLFRLLQQKNLLIVGCGFRDWLARFFIRLGKQDRLIAAGGKTDWFVDLASSEPEFVAFLEQFSRRTKYFSGSAVPFIDLLSERMPAGSVAQSPAPKVRDARDPERDILSGAVFLSYASEDRVIAEQIYQALDQSGVDCWFDRKQLTGGDDWETKIIRNVTACALFVPLVSQHTLTEKDRFFRHEWHHAFKRAIGFPANVRFLIPVAIDGTQPSEPALPIEFAHTNWERLPQGSVSAAFVELIKQAFQQAQRRERQVGQMA